MVNKETVKIFVSAILVIIAGIAGIFGKKVGLSDDPQFIEAVVTVVVTVCSLVGWWVALKVRTGANNVKGSDRVTDGTDKSLQ